jgi:hypothetical protein
MFMGYCDDPAVPRTLGTFRDLVGMVGAELSRTVTDGGDRDRLLSALRAELDWPDHPAVLLHRAHEVASWLISTRPTARE